MKPAIAFEIAPETPPQDPLPRRGQEGSLPPWLTLEATTLGIAVAALGWSPPAGAGPRFDRATLFPLSRLAGPERPSFVLEVEGDAGGPAPDTAAWPVLGILDLRTTDAARARLLPTLGDGQAFAALPWVPGPRIWETLARGSAPMIGRLPFPCADLTEGARREASPSFPSPRFQQACAEMFDVLLQQDCRAVLLCGPAGAGKSALLRYLAERIVSGTSPARLRGTRLLLLEPGVFEPTRNPEHDQQRHQALTALANLDCILAVDEAQRLASGHNQQSDALDHLKLLVTEHRARAILCTNEVHRLSGRDRALDRRLTSIALREADEGEIRDGILPLRARRAAERRGVRVGPEAQEAAHRYAALLGQHAQPHATVALLDRCVARAERCGLGEVSPALVAELASILAGRDPAAPADAAAWLGSLGARVCGHRGALARVAGLLARWERGRLDPGVARSGEGARRRPLVLVLQGPPGVGKTTLVEAIQAARCPAAGPPFVIRGAEFKRPELLTRLLGASAMFVGHGEQGSLVRFLKSSPAGTVEIAEPEAGCGALLDSVVLPLCDGLLTGNEGDALSTRGCVLVMTTNAAADRDPVGFGVDRGRHRSGPESLGGLLPGPILDRLGPGALIRLGPLERQDLAAILRRQIRGLGAALGIEIHCEVEVFESLLDRAEAAGSAGARPLRSAFEEYVEAPVLELLDRCPDLCGLALTADRENGGIEVLPVQDGPVPPGVEAPCPNSAS